MKKTVPISIRTYLEEVLIENPNLIRAVFEEKSVVVFKEKHDFDSPFYFRLEIVNVDQTGKTLYTVEYLPENHDNLKPRRHANSLEGLKKDIKTWLTLLVEYNKKSIIFDDSITQKYYDDIESKFQIVDEDADFAPHNFEQQEHLQTFLERAKHQIEAHLTPENQSEANEIIKEINETKDKISKSTKSENVSRIRRLIAKAHKFKYEVGKELLIEFMAEAIKLAISASIGGLLR